MNEEPDSLPPAPESFDAERYCLQLLKNRPDPQHDFSDLTVTQKQELLAHLMNVIHALIVATQSARRELDTLLRRAEHIERILPSADADFLPQAKEDLSKIYARTKTLSGQIAALTRDFMTAKNWYEIICLNMGPAMNLASKEGPTITLTVTEIFRPRTLVEQLLWPREDIARQ